MEHKEIEKRSKKCSNPNYGQYRNEVYGMKKKTKGRMPASGAPIRNKR